MNKNNLTQLEYDFLECESNEFTAESLEKLKTLLTIRTEGNMIYICHPSHLFETMLEDSNTKEIKYVDFDNINVQKMINLNDFGRYSIIDQISPKKNNQFTYITKKASHMIKKYQEKGVSHFSYPFAILEEINSELSEPQYFVRGIIKCNQKGFSLAFNPLAVKELPQESVWQKALRFGHNFN